MKTTRCVQVLLGGAATALVTVAVVVPALASSVGRRDAAGTTFFSRILKRHEIVSGVRGTTGGNVVLTGGKTTKNGSRPFLFQGHLTSAAKGAAVSVLTPSFRGVTTATFYGPNTHSFNPTIPSGRVRAVGTYQSRFSRSGVLNRGMIYLGPVSGKGGSWTRIDVPAHGQRTVGGVRACPRSRHGCFVMDTIPHSTMGDLVVGNYDLHPSVRGGVISGNAFIYNMSRRRWTLLRLGGSLSSKTTLYGIWQDGGPSSSNYTVAGGSSAHGSSPHGNQRAFVMNYNERTGAFGKPRFYNYGNTPRPFTHFEGITGVSGGFHLVAQSSAQASSMASVSTTGGDTPSFGPARWLPVDVAASPLCQGGCNVVTGNTVFKQKVMGLYVPSRSGVSYTYLANVSTP
jgi:hypothetical protein